MCWWAHGSRQEGELKLLKWREVFAIDALWLVTVPQMFPVKDDCLSPYEYTQTLSLTLSN